MASGATVRVEGLRELSRAFKRISKDLSDDLVKELKAAGDDVKEDAESFALGRIRNMPQSPRWSGMRIGVARAQGLVYMVPLARSRRRPGGGRSNLGDLLMDRAMDPALEKNAAGVVRKVDDLLDRLAGVNGF